MCRNIKTLFNFKPKATKEEIQLASVQYVRKISGFTKPSKVNQKVFDRTVDDIAKITKTLVDSLVTDARPRNREIEAKKARERAKKRFG